MSWNDERVEKLKTLAGNGQSASYIAAAIGGGLTRNAVIGKAHRLGVPLGSNRQMDPAVRKHVFKKLVQQAVAASGGTLTGKYNGRHAEQERRGLERAIATANEAPPQALMVQFLDLEHHHCRWPIGEPGKPGFGFCGCQKAPVGSYCQHHASMSRRETLASQQASPWGENMRKRFAAA